MNVSTVVWWRPGHYVLLGLLLLQSILTVVSNSLLILTIVWNKNLRNKKEFAVIFAVALSDWMYGSAMVLFTSKVIFSFITGSAQYPFTRHECLSTILPIYMAWGLGSQGPALLFQSIDRFMATAMPLFYFGVTARNVWHWLVVVFSFPALQVLLVVWDSMDATQNVLFEQTACAPQTAFKPQTFNAWNTTHLIQGCVSVFIFGLVLVLYRKHMTTVAPDTQRELKEHMKSQRKVTVSMGISCIATVALFIMPRLMNTVVIYYFTNVGHALFRTVAMLLYSLNPILNFFIYYRRHENIRQGFKTLFTKKKQNQVLPQNGVGEKKYNAPQPAVAKKENPLTAVKMDNGNVDAKRILVVQPSQRNAGDAMDDF